LRGAAEAGLVVCCPGGTQCCGCLIRRASGRKSLKVAQKQRNHLVVLDDLQQIRPTDRLTGKGPYSITVNRFLRPSQASQHKLKFGWIDWLSLLHWLFPEIMFYARAPAKSCASFLIAGFSGEGNQGHRLIPGGWGTLARRSEGFLPNSSSTTITVDGDDCVP